MRPRWSPCGEQRHHLCLPANYSWQLSRTKKNQCSLVACTLFLFFQINWAWPKETSSPRCKWCSDRFEPHAPPSLEYLHCSQEQLFEIAHVALAKEAQTSCKCCSFTAPGLLNTDNFNMNDRRQTGGQTKEEPLCFVRGIFPLVTKSQP